MMKNIQFTSPKTDFKVLVVSLCLGFPAIVGYLLPTPFDDSYVRLFDAFVSVTLAIFAWSAFHLIEPRRYSRKWAMAEFAIVPVVWLLLILALGVWFYHLQQARDELFLSLT